MKRVRVKVAIAVVFAVLCVLWFGVGGIVVYDYWWYGGMSTIPVRDGPSIVLCVDTHVHNSGVPFLLSYVRDKVPYSIDLSVYDYTDDTIKLFIDEFIIMNADDTTVSVVSPDDRWAKDFQNHTDVNSSSKGLIYTHSLWVDCRFQQAIGTPTDFRVKIRGRYLRRDGSVIDIDVGHSFHVEKRTEVTTGSKMWANC